MTLLIVSFLVLMVVGIPVADLHGRGVAALPAVLRRGARRDPGAAHDRRGGKLPAARRAVLHPGRQPDEHRRRHRPHLQLRRLAGRLDEGRSGAGEHHRLGDLLRHVRHGAGRCRRHRHDRDQGHEGPWLSGRSRRRRHRRLRDPRPDLPAVPALRHLRHDGERLDRRAVPGRHPARRRHDGADDGHRGADRVQARLGFRYRVRVEEAGRGVDGSRHRPGLPADRLRPDLGRPVAQRGAGDLLRRPDRARLVLSTGRP